MKGSDVAKKEKAKEKTKVGIIGLGAIGTVHADAYAATGEAQIVALCDVDAAKLAQQGERLQVKGRFKQYRDLLKSDAQAVSVCVGNALHREVATAALEAGKHILLEKPMAMNATEAAQIVAAGEKAGKVIQIGMVNRQNPAAQVVREYVQAGLLGEVHHLRTVLIRRRGIPGMGGWFTTKAASGGGPLIDIGVHWFDLAMWMSGHWEPTSVSAVTYAKFGANMRQYRYVGMWAGPPRYEGVFDVEDYAAGFVRFGKKATMSFEIAWAANAPDEAFVEIQGDKGGIRSFDGKPLTVMTEHQGRVADISPKFPERVNGFEVQARKFLAACRGEAPPAATAREGLAVMKLIDAVYASSAAGKEVPV
jgi:predicted dehydrogenase